MMNVLQLAKYYPPDFGGIELVEKMMTKAHCSNQDKVFIVAFSKNSSIGFGEFGEHITRIKETFKLLSAPFSFNFFSSFKAYILKNKIQRIYVHLPNPFMHEVVQLNKTFLKENNVEVVGVYHSDIVNKKYFGTLYEMFFYHHCDVYDKIVVSSEKLWNSSTLLQRLNNKKQRVVPFCVDEDFHPRVVTNFNKKILAIGRMVPYKGYEFLLKALKNTEYELNIIGDGPLLESLKIHSAPNIKFHLKVSDQRKNELFDECDILIVSSISRAEAYGMTIVESFGRGVPVVASNINSGVTYLVNNEKTGLVFEIESEVGLRNCLSKISTDSHLMTELSKNSRKFFEENLTFEKFKERLLTI